VGYRYYDAANKNVLFPFGFGLSYSTFTYRNLSLSRTEIVDSDTILVTMDVENTGNFDASEIVQIYVQPPESRIFKAKKELKGFAKIALKKGETGRISIILDKRSFAYFNTNIHDWHVESGVYTILAGASSRDIRLSADVYVKSSSEGVVIPDYRQQAPAYYSLDNNNLAIPKQQFEFVCGELSYDALDGLVLMMNGHLFGGYLSFSKGYKKKAPSGYCFKMHATII